MHNRAKKGQYGIIVLSSATDPYLHMEKEQQLTRRILERILYYRFPVHIITKSDLVERDFDLLHQIDQQAIVPLDLQDNLQHKVFITFSFSTIDNTIGKQFEPGATAPDKRLQALRSAISAGFLSGVSLMPLLPYITDTKEHLELMFRTFKELGVHYIFPATVHLFGNGPSDSKSLVMRAVEKYYPHLMPKYHSFFDQSNEMPAYYREAFYKKMREMSEEYGLRNRIISD